MTSYDGKTASMFFISTWRQDIRDSSDLSSSLETKKLKKKIESLFAQVLCFIVVVFVVFIVG
jgi:hypothetical protein